MSHRKKLLFISPRFLFPVSTGGQIRTTQILRGMKDGDFEITLLSPAPLNACQDYDVELHTVCDRFIDWPENERGRYFDVARLKYIFSKLPIPVATDISEAGKKVIHAALNDSPDVVVFDFPHSAVLGPEHFNVSSVMFTHNVESEIFKRHASVATNYIKRLIWKNQYRKMYSFESNILKRFDSIVAVSNRDKDILKSLYDAKNISVINTGVDLDYFKYQRPGNKCKIVFTGSMDWYANIDGIRYFLEDIYPLITNDNSDISIEIVGRNPPDSLIDIPVAKNGNVNFTGFVDDVRAYVNDAGIFIVPLRVGGGTRLKVFEAMAMGCPMVSTSIGIEGLPLMDGVHYLKADTPEDFSKAVLRLNKDSELRMRLSRAAREYVEKNFSHLFIAKEFESICMRAVDMQSES